MLIAIFPNPSNQRQEIKSHSAIRSCVYQWLKLVVLNALIDRSLYFFLKNFNCFENFCQLCVVWCDVIRSSTSLYTMHFWRRSRQATRWWPVQCFLMITTSFAPSIQSKKNLTYKNNTRYLQLLLSCWFPAQLDCETVSERKCFDSAEWIIIHTALPYGC